MNVLIVEDEGHTAALLQEIIEQDSSFIVIEKLESVVDAVAYLSKYQKNLDLLFFDIQLADGNSFEIFKNVDVVVPVIFCTAFDDYALHAIKNNGIDYILKPFKEEEIQKALAKYVNLISNFQAKNQSPISLNLNETKQYQKNFLSQYRNKSIVKRIDDIGLFSLEHETVFMHTFGGDKFQLYKKMEYIESVCDPDQFFRINRQMIVNRVAVSAFEPYFNRKIILDLKVKMSTKAVVSRLKVSAFKSWLER